MISWVASMISGDPLVFAVGAAFLIMLTLLSVSTLLANGWGLERTTAAAIDAFRRLAAATVVQRRRWQASAAHRAAMLVAYRGQAALVQRNMRIKIAGAIAVARPVRTRARQVVPMHDSGRDRRFAGRLEDLLGVYLSPPEHALVWCCDDSRQLQAVNRTASRKNDEERRATPPLRHDLLGSTPLSEALIELSSSVIGSCDRRERHTEWLDFLRQVERQAPPGKHLRVMCDNQGTQNHPAVRKWLAAHPHVRMQFTASSGSGLKMIKRFFDDVIAEQLGIRAFQSVAELTAAIGRHVAGRLTEAAPFIWVRQPAGIPATAHGRKETTRVLEIRR